MFTPVLTRSDLPAALVSNETLQLDFKRTARETISYESAKDVAAFANNLGGTILVGAAEDRSNRRLGKYEPLDERTAAEIATVYESAVRDLCYPNPVVDVRRIEAPVTAGSPGFVVAVNVWPFPAQPVGVAAGSATSRGSHSRFSFPWRSGEGTIFLTPDQLPMFTADVRRLVVLLSSIPVEKRASLTLLYFATDTGLPAEPMRVELVWDLESVAIRNTVQFKITKSEEHFTIPVDAIDHVWEEAVFHTWVVSTSGFFQAYGGATRFRPGRRDGRTRQ